MLSARPLMNGTCPSATNNPQRTFSRHIGIQASRLGGAFHHYRLGRENTIRDTEHGYDTDSSLSWKSFIEGAGTL